MWNDAIKLIQDIEIQLEMFKSILEAAYESDIQVCKPLYTIYTLYIMTIGTKAKNIWNGY